MNPSSIGVWSRRSLIQAETTTTPLDLSLSQAVVS